MKPVNYKAIIRRVKKTIPDAPKEALHYAELTIPEWDREELSIRHWLKDPGDLKDLLEGAAVEMVYAYMAGMEAAQSQQKEEK